MAPMMAPPRPCSVPPTEVSTSAHTSGSRTTPRPLLTTVRSASNWGFTRTTRSAPGRVCPRTAGSTRSRAMNDTSTVTTSAATPGSRARMSVRSRLVTRGSDRSRSCSWLRPTSTASTEVAPCCRRQSVKPPVEAPTSRAARPSTSTAKRWRAPCSFSPPAPRTGGAGRGPPLPLPVRPGAPRCRPARRRPGPGRRRWRRGAASRSGRRPRRTTSRSSRRRARRRRGGLLRRGAGLLGRGLASWPGPACWRPSSWPAPSWPPPSFLAGAFLAAAFLAVVAAFLVVAFLARVAAAFWPATLRVAVSLASFTCRVRAAFLAAWDRASAFSARVSAALRPATLRTAVAVSMPVTDSIRFSRRLSSAWPTRPMALTWFSTSLRTSSTTRSVLARLRSSSSLTRSWACSVWTSPALTRSLTMDSALAWVRAVKAIPASR